MLKAEIAAAAWDLSLNRYKQVEPGEAVHRTPGEILAELVNLEDEIRNAMKALQDLLA